MSSLPPRKISDLKDGTSNAGYGEEYVVDWPLLIKKVALKFANGRYGNPKVFLGVIAALFLVFYVRTRAFKRRGWIRRIGDSLVHLLFIGTTTLFLSFVIFAAWNTAYEGGLTLFLYTLSDLIIILLFVV